jgi:hypothetical protein
MKATLKIKRPKFYSSVRELTPTNRTCSENGCTGAGDYVTGYYLVERRRVRVWTCLEHWSGNPLLVLPTPPSILAGLRAEEEHRENMAKRYRSNAEPERGVSIKTLAPSGHGKYIGGDRVANWRWGA